MRLALYCGRAQRANAPARRFMTQAGPKLVPGGQLAARGRNRSLQYDYYVSRHRYTWRRRGRRRWRGARTCAELVRRAPRAAARATPLPTAPGPRASKSSRPKDGRANANLHAQFRPGIVSAVRQNAGVACAFNCAPTASGCNRRQQASNPLKAPRVVVLCGQSMHALKGRECGAGQGRGGGAKG